MNFLQLCDQSQISMFFYDLDKDWIILPLIITVIAFLLSKHTVIK